MTKKEPKEILPGEYNCVITESKIIRSKTGRYGLLFRFIIKNYPDNPLYHALWLGNYKDFRQDDKRKNRILWRLAATRIGKLKTKFKHLKNNNSFGCLFVGVIEERSLWSYIEQAYINKSVLTYIL